MALRSFVSILFMIMVIVNRSCVSWISLVRVSRKLDLRKICPTWMAPKIQNLSSHCQPNHCLTLKYNILLLLNVYPFPLAYEKQFIRSCYSIFGKRMWPYFHYTGRYWWIYKTYKLELNRAGGSSCQSQKPVAGKISTYTWHRSRDTDRICQWFPEHIMP